MVEGLIIPLGCDMAGPVSLTGNALPPPSPGRSRPISFQGSGKIFGFALSWPQGSIIEPSDS